MNQDEIAELKRQFFEQASWGFVSRYGRTGRILSVRADDRTLEIATPRGTLHAKVGAATNIHQTTNDGSKALTFETSLQARWSRLTAQPEPRKTPMPKISR